MTKFCLVCGELKFLKLILPIVIASLIPPAETSSKEVARAAISGFPSMAAEHIAENASSAFAALSCAYVGHGSRSRQIRIKLRRIMLALHGVGDLGSGKW